MLSINFWSEHSYITLSFKTAINSTILHATSLAPKVNRLTRPNGISLLPVSQRLFRNLLRALVLNSSVCAAPALLSRACMLRVSLHGLTFIEPTVLKTVQWVEKRHMQQTNQLTHKMDGEETHEHPLRNKYNKLNSRVSDISHALLQQEMAS